MNLCFVFFFVIVSIMNWLMVCFFVYVVILCDGYGFILVWLLLGSRWLVLWKRLDNWVVFSVLYSVSSVLVMWCCCLCVWVLLLMWVWVVVIWLVVSMFWWLCIVWLMWVVMVYVMVSWLCVWVIVWMLVGRLWLVLWIISLCVLWVVIWLWLWVLIVCGLWRIGRMWCWSLYWLVVLMIGCEVFWWWDRYLCVFFFWK